MAGAGRSDDDVGSAGQAIDDEITVRRRRIEAGLGSDEAAIGRRDMLRQRGADQCLIVRTHGLIVSVGIDRFIAVMMLGPFDAGLEAAIRWEAVGPALPAARH